MGDRFDTVVGGGFGAFPRTIRINRVKRASPGPGGVFYLVADTVQAGPGSQPVTSYVSQMADRAKLERDYPDLVKLLPAEF